MTIHPAAQGFSTAADDYDPGRPDYPPEAADWAQSGHVENALALPYVRSRAVPER